MVSNTPILKKSLAKTTARVGAVAFAAGIIGAGLVTSSASAESDTLDYTCVIGNADFTLPIVFDAATPGNAENGEEFQVSPVTGDVTAPEAYWQDILEQSGYTDVTYNLDLMLLPAGTVPGDVGTSDQEIPLVPDYSEPDYPDAGDYNFGITTPEGDLTASGKNTDRLDLVASDLTIDLDGDDAEAQTLECSLDEDQDGLIRSVEITGGGNTDDPGNDDSGNDDPADNVDDDQPSNDDDTGNTDSDVPTVINGGA